MLVFVLLRHWFGTTVAEVEANARRFRDSEAGQRADAKTIWVLITIAVALTVQNYAGHPRYCLFGSDQLSELLWWVAVAFGCYVVIPFAVIQLVLRERLSDYGLKMQGFTAGWPIYLVFVAFMIPLVWIFSAERHFQSTYPFYRLNSLTDTTDNLWRWELAYASQFVALEFFFRGFVLHGLKHRFGVYAVFVMTVPYCMIHFQKPLPECFASIVAGVVLGFMSLKTRSIWLGAALHISVAWGMDFASLYRQGLL